MLLRSKCNSIENDEKILPSNLTQKEQIIEYIKKNNKINRQIVEAMFDISKTRANDILNNLIKESYSSVNNLNISYKDCKKQSFF